MADFNKIKTVVLGIGNILLGDEGVGVHVVNRLKKAGLPPSVILIDGSTAGFKLLTLFEKYSKCNFIIIDAIAAGVAGSDLNCRRMAIQGNTCEASEYRDPETEKPKKAENGAAEYSNTETMAAEKDNAGGKDSYSHTGHAASGPDKSQNISQKGDIYLIPLKDLYETGSPGVMNPVSISFHETSLTDVLNLFRVTGGTEIKGHLIGINILDFAEDKVMELPMSMDLSHVIESRIPEIINLVKKHI